MILIMLEYDTNYVRIGYKIGYNNNGHLKSNSR